MGAPAKREVPRWRRKPPPGPVITVKGRGARKLTREMKAAAALHLPQPSLPAPGVTAASGAYRFRRHLVPFGFLGALVIAGSACHAADAIPAAVLTAIAAAAAAVLLTRHLPDFARHAAEGMALLTLLWLPVLSATGLTAPVPPFLLGTWLILVIPWVRHYRFRPGEQLEQPDISDMTLWSTTLGAKGRLAGSALACPESIPNGTRYTLSLKRGEQDSGDVFGMSKKIASLFGRPVTEVYAERFPDGREHQVTLTRLRRNTLQAVRKWDGESIDRATGLAAIGDFPDGTPAHFRFWSPRNGAEQSIVVGIKGSGKSYLLHLLLAIAVTSEVPVIPIVLDPQQGQSLPDWRGQVVYARGAEQCMLRLRAIEAGMMARSDHLADFAWTGEDGYERPGMDFYDPHLSGLPLIFAVLDEAHLLLADPRYGEEAKRIIGNLVKLMRKAGGHLMLVSHTLLLSQLGDMTLRSMVVGGNAVALRTGESLSGGIIGLEADPKLLPRIFPDGSETHGLGYIAGPDNRPDSPMRVRLVPNPRKVAVEAKIAQMDAVFGTAFHSVIGTAQQAAAGKSLSAVPQADDDKPGRTCADAILAVLDAELNRGEIVTRSRKLVTREWGRAEFSVRATGDALNKLTAAGRITRTGQGTYAPARASLHAVSNTEG